MTKRPKIVPLPTRQQVLDFIRESPGHVGKREIARAFNITGENRVVLRRMLNDLQHSGTIERGQGRRFAPPGVLDDAVIVEICGTDRDGELIAKPVEWEGPLPRIIMAPTRRNEPPLGLGDRVLARLRRQRDGLYEGRVLRRMTAGPARILGVYESSADGSGCLHPTDRRQKADYLVSKSDAGGAVSGELVLAEIMSGRPYGLKPARIVERLGDIRNPRTISLIAIQANDIPCEFSEEALQQAASSQAALLGQRTDLRMIPLVTVDGADARDFDDAVWAEATNEGWHILVAIADVVWYVRPTDALDQEAFKRGNSVYFPDRVIPMLPEALSNGWCSLNPQEDRPCLAVHIWLDPHGVKLRHQFVRGLMRSAARLTYEQVQTAIDGSPDDLCRPLLDPVLKPLYGAWKALFEERTHRGVLELDLPERQVILDNDGRVQQVVPRLHLDSHRLIEDFMIAANVAAAEQIESINRPCMYRIHDLPSPEKLETLGTFLTSVGLSFPKAAGLKPEHFNKILEKAKALPEANLINEVILRSQAQAAYSPENIGHFGLGLHRYAHFTSPIRRYADLLVHRALIAGLGLGEGELDASTASRFNEIGEHISATERRAAEAERDALNRFTAAFLADRVGAHFTGRINGVTRFGLFVTLDESGADGLIPISSLPEDYYLYDEPRHCLTGRRHRLEFTLGDAVEVRLAEANPLTSSLVFHIVSDTKKGKRPLPKERERHLL